MNQKPARARKYLETERAPYRPLSDDEGTSLKAFHVLGTPYIVSLDASGVVVYTGVGGSQHFEAALRCGAEA